MINIKSMARYIRSKTTDLNIIVNFSLKVESTHVHFTSETDGTFQNKINHVA